MIKTHQGCPICHTAIYIGSGSTDNPKCYYRCENGHRWYEYTAIEIIDEGEEEHPLNTDCHTYV